MPGPSELGDSFALSQASENARVIVPSLQKTSAEWRKCADFLHFFLSGNRIANCSASALNPAIQGALQQFDFVGELLVLVRCCSPCGFVCWGTGFSSCGYRVDRDC